MEGGQKQQQKTTVALPGHQGLSPSVAQSPKAGCLHCQPSWWRVLGPVWCGEMWELALDSGSGRMQLAPLDRLGTWLAGSSCFLWGPFILGTVGWLVGDSSLRCYFGTCGGEGAPSRLAWEAVEGDLPPPALQQETCSAWSRTCPQMYQRPSLLPGECSYLTASCLGFPRCRKRLVSGLYCTPCRYKEGCRVKCTEA